MYKWINAVKNSRDWNESKIDKFSSRSNESIKVKLQVHKNESNSLKFQ